MTVNELRQEWTHWREVCDTQINALQTGAPDRGDRDRVGGDALPYGRSLTTCSMDIRASPRKAHSPQIGRRRPRYAATGALSYRSPVATKAAAA
jgi:hypothetical protein